MAVNGSGKVYASVSILIGIIVIVSVAGGALTKRENVSSVPTVKIVERVADGNPGKARELSVTLPIPPSTPIKMAMPKFSKQVEPSTKQIVPIRPRAMKPEVSTTQNSKALSYKVLQPRKKVAGLRVQKLQKTQIPKRPVKKSRAPSVVFPRQNTVRRANSRQSVASGRVLLRLLEHGKGPTIDIAWPESQARRQNLYHVLRDCYGMIPTLLVKNRLLYSLGERAGQAWELNSDRYSGFLRSPIGKAIPEERQMFRSIAARHRLSRWRAVRIYPRNVDAVLLRGLRKLIGNKYSSATRVRAHYSLERGRGLVLSGIEVDGGAVAGLVEIPPSLNAGCRI